MEKLKIYPNPARDHIIMEKSVAGASKISTVTIANTMGKKLKSIPVNPDDVQAKIDVSELGPGFYLLFFDDISIPPKIFSKVKSN